MLRHQRRLAHHRHFLTHAVPFCASVLGLLTGCGSSSGSKAAIDQTGSTSGGAASTGTSTDTNGGSGSDGGATGSGSSTSGTTSGTTTGATTGATTGTTGGTATTGANAGTTGTTGATGTTGTTGTTGRTTGTTGSTTGTTSTTTGGDGGVAVCTPPPDAGPVVGWASVSANGVTTTKGGEGGTVVTVTSGTQLNGYLGGTTAMIIQIAGAITGSFNIGSNKTLVGCGGSIQGHIGISGSSNVIVRNLKIVGNNCTDIDPGMGCSTGADAVGIGNNAHHIWFDHDDISDGSDGNLDINHAADYITISWTHFWYSTKRVDTGPNAANGGHRFSDLLGSADTDTGDMGHLKTTFHHNWWGDNAYERMPRVRFGQVHLFNNLYTPVGDAYCIGVGVSADIRAENNVFQSVNKPIDTIDYSDANSHMQSIGNLYTNSPPGADLNPPSFDPSTFYTYTLDATADLPAAIMAGIGPR